MELGRLSRPVAVAKQMGLDLFAAIRHSERHQAKEPVVTFDDKERTTGLSASERFVRDQARIKLLDDSVRISELEAERAKLDDDSGPTE